MAIIDLVKPCDIVKVTLRLQNFNFLTRELCNTCRAYFDPLRRSRLKEQSCDEQLGHEFPRAQCHFSQRAFVTEEWEPNVAGFLSVVGRIASVMKAKANCS